MTSSPPRPGAPARAAATLAAAALLVASACATARAPTAWTPPAGGRALGLDFGRDRLAAEAALRAARIAFAPVPGDADALVAERCPEAPVPGPCRLQFGPAGLYAAQIDAPPEDEGRLVAEVTRALGAPSHRGGAAVAAESATVVAAWERPSWTVGVSRLAPRGAPPTATLRFEYEAATPPVVAGVPLGRLRADAERVLVRQGATVIGKDGSSITYLGCPGGDPEALSCVVSFRHGRAAAVTEVRPSPADDDAALEAWRALARRYEADIGRAPATDCPAEGPDRVGGDCTSTWASERLVVVVGAHRGAGARHRGAISVYTSFTYPPLAPRPGEDPADESRDAP